MDNQILFKGNTEVEKSKEVGCEMFENQIWDGHSVLCC
jgi:hypothetical protein